MQYGCFGFYGSFTSFLLRRNETQAKLENNNLLPDCNRISHSDIHNKLAFYNWSSYIHDSEPEGNFQEQKENQLILKNIIKVFFLNIR